MFRIKYWDGSRPPEKYKTRTDGIEAAKLGLKDWMNPGDDYHVHHELSDDCAYVWVVADGEGTDASAKIYRMD